MRETSTFEGWQESRSKSIQKQQVRYTSAAAQKVTEILSFAGIGVNGSEPWDIQVHDERFFDRALGEGSIGVGESYMDGWWDVQALDEFFTRFRRADLASYVHDLKTALLVLKTRVLNLQTMQRAKEVAQAHYDLGNELYQAMLDRRMQYTCAYWKDAATLDQAQENKLHLICRKLQLKPGMTLLELGGGFGGLAHFAAKEYCCQVVSYNISREQVAFGRELCKGLPVRFEQKDYREAAGETSQFDRVASIGLCEHIGYKNYRQFMQLAHGRLKDQGLFLLHTIGGNESYSYTDPWIHKYIFPNGLVPSMVQLTTAWEGVWVAEDWHNFGPDYDLTCMQWWKNFDRAWPELRASYSAKDAASSTRSVVGDPIYSDRFYRMWKYYLMASAGSFRARRLQLWQIVLSKGDIPSYTPVR
ncbi:MAG: cyclopropane fatty acyl phospholipid synthase [Acidobacteriia bacterium]|nr:cyclopropane fatty acyl phospholipid synthase [Terriglobia bacterium]